MYFCDTIVLFIFQKGRFFVSLNDIIIQAIGGIGLLLGLFSFLFKSHGKILFFRTLNEFIFIIQYFLLGAYTGMAMNAIGCIRNLIFTSQVKKGKSTIWSGLIFIVIFIVFGIATFAGTKSVTVIIAKVMSTVAYGNKNTTVVRTVSFVTHISYLIYNISVFTIAGALSDAITLVSLIIGIVRFDLIPYFQNRQKLSH